jgi:tetraacyldisaccharide 4'-kinase
VKHFSFPDHYVYSKKDLQTICEAAGKEQAAVVTTEKDVVKMDVGIFQSSSVSLNYLPIEIEFIKSGKEFDEMVLNTLRKHVL